MALNSIVSTDTFVELRLSNGQTIRFDYSALPPGSDKKKANALKSELQNAIDSHVPLSDFPADDPIRQSNPAHDSEFWSTVNGQPHITYRPITILDAWKDGDRFILKIKNNDLRFSMNNGEAEVG